MPATRQYETPRRRSSIGAVLEYNQVWFWTPLSASIAFVVGGLFAAGLHLHYSRLDGKHVGSLTDQWWALFLGLVLAYLAQVNLAFAIKTISIQYMWWELKRQEMTICGIDAAFSATSDLMAFINREIWRKTPRATAIAFMYWFLPVITFITPATLNVRTTVVTAVQQIAVPFLAIGDPAEFQRFSYTINSTTGFQKFLGPRTIISRIGLAASTTGSTLLLPLPATNATYEQFFYGPYVQCSNSTQEVRTSMDEMIRRFSTTSDSSPSELVLLDYFAAVPALSNRPDNSSAIEIANLSDVDGPLYSSNQIWIFGQDFEPSMNFSTPTTPRYLTCELFNASYAARFSWQNGAQDIEVHNLAVLNPVPYPTIESAPTPESQVAKSYSAIMSSLASQLVGSVAFYKDVTSSTRRIYSSIQSGIAQTVLLGSSDFDAHFRQNHLLGLGYGDSGLPSLNDTSDGDGTLGGFSDQRLQDMAYVRSRPLEELIPELSKNITLSLLSDSLLSPSTDTEVSVIGPATIYAYRSQNVLIVYTVMFGLAFIVMCLGGLVIFKSRVCYNTSFSSIAFSTMGLHFCDLKDHERLGALPLPTRLKKTVLRFYTGGVERLWGFGVAGYQPDREQGFDYSPMGIWHSQSTRSLGETALPLRSVQGPWDPG